MRIAQMFAALAATTLVLAACTSQKEPAEKAAAQIESSLAEFRADAEKYAAEGLKEVDDAVANLKKNLASKDYSAVIIAAPSARSAVSALKQTVAMKKADMEATLAAAQAEWDELSTSVPPMVDKVQAELDKLAKSRKLPKDLDKAKFETVKTDFEAVKTQWTEASSQFASGMAADAVRKARIAKAKGEEILTQLGIKEG